MIPKLSLILACYNEEPHFNNSMRRICEVLDKLKYSYEIIFIDDKSIDNTKDLIKNFCSKNKNSHYIFHKINVGRGGSVTDGIKISKGKFVGFIDIDLELDASYIPSLIKKLEQGYDVANAYRIYQYKLIDLHRILLSRGYAFLVRNLLNISIKDPAAGLKFFKREKILPILNKTEDKHWFWEIEIMTRAYLRGLKIAEVPCIFIRKTEKKSTLKLFRDSWHYFTKLLDLKSKIENGQIKTTLGK